mmetsp:Transcript_28340/g.68941  ORF Transcript_28340/g.68941 Transcript_28340/m.68941 type:complete len:91 (+) Transcript_28340:112-384(+)
MPYFIIRHSRSQSIQMSSRFTDTSALFSYTHKRTHTHANRHQFLVLGVIILRTSNFLLLCFFRRSFFLPFCQVLEEIINHHQTPWDDHQT